jgi:hypothetical protein
MIKKLFFTLLVFGAAATFTYAQSSQENTSKKVVAEAQPAQDIKSDKAAKSCAGQSAKACCSKGNAKAVAKANKAEAAKSCCSKGAAKSCNKGEALREDN